MHALATPLLTKADGTKFGKTESGTVWLDPQMTSPYAFHQFFLNAEDEKVIEYLKVFSPRSRAEIAELARQTAEQPHLRAAQKALADDVTALVHSPAEREAAVAAASALFGRRRPGRAGRADAGRRGGRGRRRRAREYATSRRPWWTCSSAAGWWRAEARRAGRSPRAGPT